MTPRKGAGLAGKHFREKHTWQDHTSCCGVWRPAGWGCVGDPRRKISKDR